MSKILHFLASLPIGRQLSERHRPSSLPTAPPEPPDSIESYLDACRRKVEAARTDLDSQQRAWIVEGNSPFVLKPDTPGRPGRGILMLHGLSDSPFLVRDIARYFHRKGFYVLAMQLPGHGTRPGDLLHVSWKDWATAHQQLLELMRAEVDDIYLLGFSAGATLNLYQSIRNADIKGLFMFAPALRISFLSWLACPLAYLGKWSRRLAWFDVQPDTDCFKYESLTTRSICEVREMIKAVRRLNALVEREIPVFVAASEKDVAVDSRAMLNWFSRQKGAPKRMLYYSTGHPTVTEHVKVIPARVADQNIKSFAHTSLLQSPSNPHYGARGEYRFCTHYYQLDPHKYQRCKEGREDCLGEMFDESPDCQVVRRLTYNPLFEDMLAEISRFLKELDGQ